jgi:hypothetical protein
MWCSRSAWPSSLALTWSLLAGCGSGSTPARGEPDAAVMPALTREQLLDPASCKSCHPKHYREWRSSMHAYAADDPVFLAMNKRGQRETEGALGDFCVGCHAPMAVHEGETTDGLNLDQLPEHLRGVTCYYCHNVAHTGQPFNNDLTLADDLTMRGAISNPAPTSAHASAYSPHQDRNRSDSSALCGTCHDVVTPHGVKLERTFLEYQNSLFAKPGPGFDTCSGCHMPGRPGRAAEGVQADAPLRSVHEHLWPGVDVALGDFPDREAQRRAVECALALNTRIYSIGLSGVGEVAVKVETNAGHHQPSGTAQDRRLWLELTAYDEQERVVFQSGAIQDGEVEEKTPGQPGFDPNLALFRDWLYDAEGQPVHMFWEAAPSALYPDGYSSLTLPAPLMLNTPHTLEARYRIPDFTRVKRVRVQLRMRPVGIDVLEELVHSGDLDAKWIAEMPTFTLHGAALDWYPTDDSTEPLYPSGPLSADGRTCPDSYRCLLEGGCAE